MTVVRCTTVDCPPLIVIAEAFKGSTAASPAAQAFQIRPPRPEE